MLTDLQIATRPPTVRVRHAAIEPTSCRAIVAAVAAVSRVPEAELLSRSRYLRVTRPRQVAMWLCRTHRRLSYAEIGRRLGGRDHTTAMHAFRKVAAVAAALGVDEDTPYADALRMLLTATRFVSAKQRKLAGLPR